MEDIKGIKTVSELVSRVEGNTELSAKLSEKPTEVLRAAEIEIRDNQEVPNTPIYMAAVFFVGSALIVSIVGALILVGLDKITEAPEWVVAVTSAGIGALAGMLRT